MKRIIKITDLDGNDRTDGQRIGTVCKIAFLEIDRCMLLDYISRPGVLRTSTVTKIERNKITTLNSIYYFEDVEPGSDHGE